VKAHPRYEEEIKQLLGEFAQYIEKIEDIRPDFKYYVVADGNKIDYISQGNKDLNAARSFWTLTARDKFNVNFTHSDGKNYYTTLYTDFAYSLPEGVEAYIVTNVDGHGNTVTQKVTGTIPAQAAVLLKATAAGQQELTIATAGNANLQGNMLVGADYFINKYGIKTEQLVTLFNWVKSILGDNFYNNYVAQYEHLMALNAGTVHNKYFWALSQEQVEKCVEGKDCVIRSLSDGDQGLGFYDNWTAPANQAFLDNLEFNPVKLVVKNDVTRDGRWDVDDVTATINITLGKADPNNNYDYVAADFNNDGKIDVDDVAAMINYILGK
jgi:hypothetical protein